MPEIMKRKYVLYMSIMVLLGSCYPNGAEEYEDLDIVYTNYDDQFDFSVLSNITSEYNEY
jgi:hypothetical protein